MYKAEQLIYLHKPEEHKTKGHEKTDNSIYYILETRLHVEHFYSPTYHCEKQTPIQSIVIIKIFDICKMICRYHS